MRKERGLYYDRVAEGHTLGLVRDPFFFFTEHANPIMTRRCGLTYVYAYRT